MKSRARAVFEVSGSPDDGYKWRLFDEDRVCVAKSPTVFPDQQAARDAIIHVRQAWGQADLVIVSERKRRGSNSGQPG